MNKQEAKQFVLGEFKNGTKPETIRQALESKGYKTNWGTAASLPTVYGMIKEAQNESDKPKINGASFSSDMSRSAIKRECKALYNNGMKVLDILKLVNAAGITRSNGSQYTKSFICNLLKLKAFKINRKSPKKGITYDIKKKPSLAQVTDKRPGSNTITFVKQILTNESLSANKRIAMALLAME
jgi:hypothetical protein